MLLDTRTVDSLHDLAAVVQDGRALKHASVEMQADRDVVLAAVPLAQRRTATWCLSEPYLTLPYTLIS